MKTLLFIFLALILSFKYAYADKRNVEKEYMEFDDQMRSILETERAMAADAREQQNKKSAKADSKKVEFMEELQENQPESQ